MTATVTTAPERVRRAPAPGRTRPPELRVVERPVRRRPVGAVAAVAVIVVFGALMMNAIFHSVLVSGQAHLDKLNGQVTQQQSEDERLRLRLATLDSPERIVQAATAAGMEVPSEVHWVMPQSGGSAISSTSQRAAGVPTTDPGSGSTTAENAAGATASSSVPSDGVPQGR